MERPGSLLCSARDSQLVVIDIQGRLAQAMPEGERDRVLARASILARGAGALEVPVLATEQYPKGLGPTAQPIEQALPPATPMFTKTCFSCGGAEGFLNALSASERKQVVLAGMETHVCVLQSALELQGHGYQLFVAEDAVCSRNPAHHHNALARLRQAGVVVSNTESILFEWLRDAGHKQFKTLSALIK